MPQGKDIYLYILLISALIGAWCLGRLSVYSAQTISSPTAVYNVFDKATDRFECQVPTSQGGGAASGNGGNTPVSRPTGSVVGSKNGSKYHHLWCSGVKSIKEENQIWFDSAEAAQAAGYTQAGNCK